ncbi:hypothetical protein N7448_010714 [Penicillium atrosanguineum]|nr:hypothetical protein N7448_010714 [Penicillium atrosanguineum]
MDPGETAANGGWLGAPNSTKPYSCVVCHNRKVKCDRNEPCSNCAKSKAECIYRPPPPPRRRKRERDAGGSASQERDKPRKMSDGENFLNDVVDSHLPTRPRSNGSEFHKAGTGRMIEKDGRSVYLDNTFWTSVSYELPDAADVLGNGSDGDDNLSQDGNEESIDLFNSDTRQSLTGMHPNQLHIFKLWQTFLENVNPLTKILHAPTVQQQILDAMSDLSSISTELEALMFSIYCISLVSLPAADVEKSFGESKKKLLPRCRRGVQLAFRNASFLRTSSVMVLQAFMLYLLSMRAFSDPQTIWTLAGIALRIAQRIGIHRDGSGYGLSIFETEIRRRIWFQLIILDATSAQFCGVASTPMLVNADTQPPMNANDSDLDPRMREPACEKEGPSEMIFCLARSEFGKWLRRWSKDARGSNSPWAFLSSSSMSLREKDNAIDELEDSMEQKYLRYCDKSIPLHLAATLMARSAIYFTRLIAHHPRQYQDPNTRIPEAEKNTIFDHCLKMAEYANYAQTNPDVQRFSWHMVNYMPWDAMIFMLSEMRNRADPEEKNKVWQLIGNIYSRHVKQMRKHARLPLHTAMQNLIVKAWRAYIEECNLHQRTPTPCPTIVAKLCEDFKGSTDSRPAEQNPVMIEQGVLFQHQAGTSHADFSVEALNSDFLLTDSPMDWNEWDNLLNQFQESLVDDMTFLPRSGP